jgi:hypothetical protein
MVVIAGVIGLVITGCAAAPKPNGPSQWGLWSYMPGTSAWKARRAEQVKQPRNEEAQRQLTTATDELISEAITADARRVPTNTLPNIPLVAAKAVSRQNVLMHGTPDKPIDVRPLISTNATERDEAFEKLYAQFERQQKELTAIKQVLNKQAQMGADSQKQDSSAAVTTWRVTEAIKNFINAHWFALTIGGGVLGYLVWKAGKVAAQIYCPPVALGMNVVEGVSGKALSKGVSEMIHAGEQFKEAVDEHFTEEQAQKIKALFREWQERRQSAGTQEMVKQLTRK